MRIQAATERRTIVPSKNFMVKRYKSLIKTMEANLKSAIEMEDYEYCCKLRDRITEKRKEIELL